MFSGSKIRSGQVDSVFDFSRGPTGGWRWARESIVALLFLTAGVVSAFHPMLLSGFQRIQTDPGDTRFNHYVLEHSYRWVIGEPLHRELWNPPIFAPQDNVLAYSDTLLAVAPIYWGLRGMGIDA
ncbi:MAG: hypothetical protein KDA84_28550, partial [Planctomycetaceae bacterium]|nr:hypothetical protein [Planctomycetaceae bacterium]